MTTLARKLRFADYFSVGFGVMVGVGWLVVMDDWLLRGGPAGALLGFALGAALLLPVGWVYGKLTAAIPDAGAEVAYTAKVFPSFLSFATGWVMMPVYLMVCPYEAVAIGRIAGYLFPALNTFELYSIGGYSVYLPHLALGLALTVAFTALNYRGVHLSAGFLRWTTLAVLTLVALFSAAGLRNGSPANSHPAFSHTPLVSVLLVLQIVPYFMTGFDAVGKCAEEASVQFQPKDFSKAVITAIVVGFLFYAVIITAVAFAAPWQSITHERFATAVAFERALGSRWIVNLIMVTALISLLKIFNANLLTTTRLLFGLGRRKLIRPEIGYIHPVYQTPSVAIMCAGVVIAAGILLGNAVLVPISEIGSAVGPFGWMMACAAYYKLSTTAFGKSMSVIGAVVTLALILMKVLPFIPGSFSHWEWLALVLWCALGLAIRNRRPEVAVAPSAISEAS